MSTNTAERFREYAADCIQQATGANSPEDKNIFLNMALAWVRLAHQSQGVTDLLGHGHGGDDLPGEHDREPPEAAGSQAA